MPSILYLWHHYHIPFMSDFGEAMFFAGNFPLKNGFKIITSDRNAAVAKRENNAVLGVEVEIFYKY